MSGLLPEIGEDCGGVYIIRNLSEKGSFIELPVKNRWIYIRINKLSEGRIREKGRKRRRAGRETGRKQRRQQFLATARVVWLPSM